ncbi:PF11193 family protein [Peptostreptococcaceae bacterium AS15]|nr:PF11193 family protein [Peptostreptococcaceae bacterium AS15]
MKTTVKKTFVDITKEEQWLNERGEEGKMLIKYSNGEYEFEDVSPAKFQYKIDIPKYMGQNKKEYFKFLEQTGISVIAEYAGRVYLRKNKADGELELYTETEELNRQMKKRYSFFISVGVSQFMFGVFFLIQMKNYIEQKSAPFWILLVFGLGFAISGVIFFITGILKQKKNLISKEDRDIWE